MDTDDRQPRPGRVAAGTAVLMLAGALAVPGAAAEQTARGGTVRAVSEWVEAGAPTHAATGAVAPDGVAGVGPGGRFEQLTDNLRFAAHVPFEHGTEMTFQRREEPHRRAGRVVGGTRDYAFLGSDATHFRSAGGRAPADGVGFRVVDVTDPSAPEVIAAVRCPGHLSAVQVHEDYLLQGIERPAPFAGLEGAPSNTGCAEESDPDGLDVPGSAGVRVFDVSDPARPRLVRFVEAAEFGGGGVHNISVVPWAGLAYLSTFTLFGTDPRVVHLDLTDPALPLTVLPMRDISPTATNECHDLAFDPQRELGLCAAFDQGHVWDMSDPRRPRQRTTLVNDGIFHYHGMRLAPDGRTLVVAAEQTGPDELVLTKEVGVGGNSCVGDPRSGALWFYDLPPAGSPRLLGTFAPPTPMPTKGFCTAHGFNFVDDDRLVAGFLEGGTVVVDYGGLPGRRGRGTPAPLSVAEQVAWSLPRGSSAWTSYYWHGHLFSLGYGEPGGGLWVMALDGLGDLPSAPQDEGTAYGRWTSGPAPARPEGRTRHATTRP